MLSQASRSQAGACLKPLPEQLVSADLRRAPAAESPGAAIKKGRSPRYDRQRRRLRTLVTAITLVVVDVRALRGRLVRDLSHDVLDAFAAPYPLEPECREPPRCGVRHPKPGLESWRNAASF